MWAAQLALNFSITTVTWSFVRFHWMNVKIVLSCPWILMTCYCYKKSDFFTFLQTLMTVRIILHVKTVPPVQIHLVITDVLVLLVGRGRIAMKVRHCFFFRNIEWQNCFFKCNEQINVYIFLDFDECVELQPCENGAVCFHRLNDFHCVCMPGWTGKTCTAVACE